MHDFFMLLNFACPALSVRHAKLRSRTKISIIDNSMSTGQHISVPSSSLAIKDTTNIANVNLLLCVHRNPRSVSINLVVKLWVSKRTWWRQLILCVHVQGRMLKIQFQIVWLPTGLPLFRHMWASSMQCRHWSRHMDKQPLYHMPGWLTLAEQVQAPHHAWVLKSTCKQKNELCTKAWQLQCRALNR